MNMENNNELPIYTLHGTDFYVDVFDRLLREVADPDNKLFIKHMDDIGKFYEFEYDKRDKSIVMPDFHMCESIEDIVNAKLPPLGQLDPKRMAEKYGYQIEQIKGMSDQEIVNNQPGLIRRLSEFLPEIELMPDHIFLVDWQNRQIWIKEDFHNGVLHFNNMVKTRDETAYLCAYHIPSKTEYQLEANANTIPKDVVILEIPYELKLDPVAVGREYNVNLNTLLTVFPVQKELKAKVVHLSETELSRFFELNRTKQQLLASEIKNENRPRLK